MSMRNLANSRTYLLKLKSPGVLIAAGALSLLLLALFASRYFIVGFPISLALAVWAWQAQT